MTSQPLLAAEQLGLVLQDQTLLEHIDLRVDPGQIVTLIGPNGAGKTTLVRLLLGLLQPTQGRVQRRPGLRVGYMPQQLTIEDTLPLSVGRFLTLGGQASRTAIHGVLTEVGAADIIDRPLQRVSGGELQRTLLARALLREPELLVLDEPVQGVDVAGQYALYDLINRIRRQRGCGVLMVSHDLHLVMAHTDLVVCLHRHVCCAGTPDDVGAHPAYQRLFGHEGSRHLAVYHHHHDHHHDLHGEVQAETDGKHHAG